MSVSTLRSIFGVATVISVAACILVVLTIWSFDNDPWRIFVTARAGRMIISGAVVIIALISVTSAVALARLIKAMATEKSYMLERIRKLEKRLDILEKGQEKTTLV